METKINYHYYIAGGPGGQHRNKKATAVKATCDETGISATATERRSQHQNKALATQRLQRKLKLMAQVRKARFNVPNIRVRTYNAIRNTVKDHRLPDSIYTYKGTVEGHELDAIIQALKSGD